jgi:hypothetical protein
MGATLVPEWGPELFAHPISKATMEVPREQGFDGAEVSEFCRRAGLFSLSDLPG